MKINEEGLKLIKEFEGCMLYSYRDAVGIPTCGYGHTGSDVKFPMTINQTQADQWLKEDIEKFEKHVNMINELYNYDFNINEFSALVSFAFNVGSIKQLTKNGERNKVEIADSIMLYNKAGGRILSGLVRRRLAEYNLFTKPVEDGFMDNEIVSIHDHK